MNGHYTVPAVMLFLTIVLGISIFSVVNVSAYVQTYGDIKDKIEAAVS